MSDAKEAQVQAGEQQKATDKPMSRAARIKAQNEANGFSHRKGGGRGVRHERGGVYR